MTAPPLVVCLYCPRADGKILAIARPEDSSKFVLPGGKAERGESRFDTLRRETQEEIGFYIKQHDSMTVDEKVDASSGREWNVVIMMPCKKTRAEIAKSIEHGSVGPEGTELRWATMDELLSGGFNRDFLTQMNRSMSSGWEAQSPWSSSKSGYSSAGSFHLMAQEREELSMKHPRDVAPELLLWEWTARESYRIPADVAPELLLWEWTAVVCGSPFGGYSSDERHAQRDAGQMTLLQLECRAEGISRLIDLI